MLLGTPMLLGTAIGVALVILVEGGLWLLRGRRRRARIEAAYLPPPLQFPLASPSATEGAQAASVAAILEQKIKEAPRLFAEARRLEAVRAQMKCCCCDEPTAITCEACGQRCCVGHLSAHACVVDEEEGA